MKVKNVTRIDSGNVSLKGFTVEEEGKVFKPESVKLRRGPYNIHMSVLSTPSQFTVQSMKVKSRRPSLLEPTRFADLRSVKLDGISSMKELREI